LLNAKQIVHHRQAGLAQEQSMKALIVFLYVETGSLMREKLVMLLIKQMTILMDVMHLAKQFKDGTV